MGPLFYRSACELADLIRSWEITPIDLMEETLARIEAVNPAINAFASVCGERAMEEARKMTRRLAAGENPGPLCGIPLGVKDLEDAQGLVTSYGSTIYRENVAVRDSVQVARLKAAGAIVVGKTNVPEFGFTGFTKNRVYGVTRNPWNPERTPGGSSGGSAAAVTAGMVPMATGSDAGGSIRIPASYSGCFGIKPTFGRIPAGAFIGPLDLLNVHPFLSLGPLTRTVEDAAAYLDCTAGYHPSDPSSLPAPEKCYVKLLKDNLGALRIAYSPDLGYARVQKDVLAVVEKALSAFEEMGHGVERWKGGLPDVAEAWTRMVNWDYYIQLHRDLEQNRKELGKMLVASLELARSDSVSGWVSIQEMRTELNRLLWGLFDEYDLLVTPTMPTDAFDAKGPPPSHIDGHPIPLLGAVAFTYPFNVSGHPAATVPAGFSDSGLPVGLQIVGPHHREDRILQVAYAFEQTRPWRNRKPEIETGNA